MKKVNQHFNHYIFRISPRVFFIVNKDQVTILGPFGVVNLDVSNRGIQLYTTIRFSKSITYNQSSLLKQAVMGVSCCHFLTLKLKGIGYRVEHVGQELHFKLGYSHPVEIIIPNVILCECTKNQLKFKSAHFLLLKNFGTALRRFRFPDRYKGQGVLYDEEIVYTKEGKKT